MKANILFLHCHGSYAINEIFLINKITSHVAYYKIKDAMALSDHAAIGVGICINTDMERKERLNYNTSLLSTEVFNIFVKRKSAVFL